MDNISSIVMSSAGFMYFGGLLLILSDDLLWFVQFLNNIIRKKLKKIVVSRKETAFDKSIRYLIIATFGDNGDASKISVMQFKTITSALFLFTFLNGIRLMNVMVAFLIALSFAAMPYLLLRLWLERIRSKSSNIAELLVSELLIKYKIKNFNMVEAIDAVKESKEISDARHLLSRLLAKLRTASTDGEVREATNIFGYSINTNWARMLSSNIYQSCRSGVNVSLSMEDILLQLREARYLKEEGKRNMAESKRIFLAIPFFYFLLFFFASNWLDIDAINLAKSQFGTSKGMMFFSMIVGGSFLSYTVLSLLNSKKLDF